MQQQVSPDNDTYLLLLDDEILVTSATASHISELPDVFEENNVDVQSEDVSSYRWVKNCTSVTDSIDLEDPRVIGSLVPLGVICLVVIFGNIMVIAAVRMTRKMRGATNLFIVSLAWADLTLGCVVLPFSAMFEVFGVWIFGHWWCSIWLAIDVWTCTASILHLVVISLDRYIAVTKPITYPNIMTSNRAKLLILAAWVLSFVICFPPLVGWKEESAETSPLMNGTLLLWPNLAASSDIDYASNRAEVKQVLDRCFPKCELIQEKGYVIYSAVGSFYIPMLLMMWLNWKIFRTASKTTKAIRQGWTKVKGIGDDSVGMGIHRGGGASNTMSMTSNNYSVMNKKATELARQTGNGSSGSPHTCTKANALRRHQTISVDAGSRTLPRSTSSSLDSNRMNNLGVAKPRKRRGSATPLTTVSSSKKEDDGPGEEAHLKVPLLNGSAGNCLSIPGNHQNSNDRSRSPSPTTSSKGSRPNVSHHQPCPNHIMGKTFAEQGTQTFKNEKPQSNSEVQKKNRGKLFKKWRVAKKCKSKVEIGVQYHNNHKTNSSNNSPQSPLSITAAGRNRKYSKPCCPQLVRLRVRLTKKRSRKRSLGDGESDNEGPPSPSQTSQGNTVSNPSTLNRLAPMEPNHHHATKLGKRNIKTQVRRFRMETKAAKTLGIIIGCFICCWFPFFTMYLITAFCKECFPSLAFSVIFWLGYCNSAINPFIYAMFSRDFRNAFKKILCKFLCNRNQNEPGGALARMGLPFAPQTMAIGLADRFPPTTMVTNAAGVTRAGGHSSSGGDNNSSITQSSMRRKSSIHP